MSDADTRVLLPSLTCSLPVGKFWSLEGRAVFLFEFPTTVCASPHPTPLFTSTVLLELFASQVVTGNPWHIVVCPLLCSIIYTSFKRVSLQPLVTPCHLPWEPFRSGCLLSCCASGSPQLFLAPNHRALIPTLVSRKGCGPPPSVPLLTFPKALTSQKHLSGICQ